MSVLVTVCETSRCPRLSADFINGPWNIGVRLFEIGPRFRKAVPDGVISLRKAHTLIIPLLSNLKLRRHELNTGGELITLGGALLPAHWLAARRRPFRLDLTLRREDGE